VAKRRTKGDKRELSLFAQYMHRRADKPTKDPAVAYAEIFGDVVYEDNDYKNYTATGECKLCGGLGFGHTCLVTRAV
jgi:hypothetical protein